MDEVRCPMCSKPNPMDAEVCEFCGARIKPLIIQQDPEGESQPDPQEPRDQSEQPADQVRAETDWLSRMRYGAEEGEISDQELEEDPSVPKRGETDLLGRFRDLGISDDAEGPSLEEDLLASVPAPDDSEEVKDVEQPFDFRKSFPIPADDFDTEELLLTPDEDFELGDRLSVPVEDFDISQRLSVPDQDEEIEEELQAPDEESDLGDLLSSPEFDAEKEDRPSLPDREIDFDQILSMRDLGVDSDTDLPEAEGEGVSGPPSLEDVLPAIISDEPRSEQAEDTEVVPDWLARIRAREEVEETSEPIKTGDTDWLTGLREVDLTSDRLEQEVLTPEEEILPLESVEAKDDDLEPLQPDSALVEEQKKKEVPFDPSFSSVEDLISELDTIALSESEDLLKEDLLKEEPVTFDEQTTSIDDLISELDDLSSEDPSLEPEEATPLDFDTPSPEREGGLQLEDFFADIVQTSADSEEVKIDERIFADLEPAEEKTEEQVSPEDLFSSIFDSPSDQDDAEPMDDFLAEPEEVTAEGEDKILGDDFFADLGLEVSTDIGKPSLDDSGIDFTELSEEEPPLDHPEIVDETSDVRQIQPTDDRFLEDLLDDASELDAFDFAPGSDPLAKDTDLSDLRELSSDLSEEAPFGGEPREKSPLGDILSDFSPSWMDEIVVSTDGELPHVPALILDEELPPIDGLDEDGEAISVEIPSWLQDLGKDVEEELEAEDEDLPVLAKATLPPWLEAMRPLETFRASPEIELEEEEEIIEAAGPLAGLRGVLLAEPVVAMPRTPVVSVGTLDISDRDYSQTEILQRMVEEEESEEEGIVTRRIPFPLIRWITAALLILGVVIPTLFGVPRFNSPIRAPIEFSPFIEIVQSLPTGTPALLVFDYEPGYSAEMDAVAGAVVEQLISQGQPIVTLSTQPSGPLLADRMLRRVGSIHVAKNGEDYLHLGYLSGGPTAIQHFATSPAQSVVRGFKLPEEFENQDAWDTPLLANIGQLSDFSMVAVISSGTESARNWAEQVQPLMGNSPFVMVLSAGAEPIVRPYYDAEDKQVDGILSGLPSAMIYEGVNGLQADATQRWNGYGSSLLISVMILLTGAVIGVVRWITKWFDSRES